MKDGEKIVFAGESTQVREKKQVLLAQPYID